MSWRRRKAASVFAASLLALACRSDGAARRTNATMGVELRVVATGLASPVFLTAPAGDPRLFIVEQPGRIRIVENGRLLAAPFLDLTDRVRSGGERGLLSVAFHPHYAENGFLYVDYTDRDGNTRIERFHVGASRDVADPASARLLLEIDQPYANHNGGLVTFGLDGMLYVGMGDGGSGGDPHRNGQNARVLLGKLLRIDVDHGEPYAIPRDNPFADGRSGRPEIWALGMRNPWRFSFDRATGLLYVADVGQDRWEEVDVVPARSAGLNYGWNLMEGRHPFDHSEEALRTARSLVSLVDPVLEYGHSEGCSVTGGYVYRGRELPALVGEYFYADYCRGRIRSFRFDGHRALADRAWDFGDLGQITSFGEDGAGELYVLAQDGRVFRFVKPA